MEAAAQPRPLPHLGGMIQIGHSVWVSSGIRQLLHEAKVATVPTWKMRGVAIEFVT